MWLGDNPIGVVLTFCLIKDQTSCAWRCFPKCNLLLNESSLHQLGRGATGILRCGTLTKSVITVKRVTVTSVSMYLMTNFSCKLPCDDKDEPISQSAKFVDSLQHVLRCSKLTYLY